MEKLVYAFARGEILSFCRQKISTAFCQYA